MGWFRYESTTELYDVPPSSVWSDVVDLVGGTAPLTERAAAHAKAGRPLQALHLTDVVLANAPADADALAVKRQALKQLLTPVDGRTTAKCSGWNKRSRSALEEGVEGDLEN